MWEELEFEFRDEIVLSRRLLLVWWSEHWKLPQF